jgi:ketopantoate reductase
MRFVIVGTGGVGGFFGAKLFASGQDVRFIARGAHLAAMLRAGLAVYSPDGNLHVPADRITGDTSCAGSAEAILFCVKTYDTVTAARGMAPMLSRETLVISLQNGVESEQALQRLIPASTVYHDLSHGKPLEIEALSGAVVRYGAQVGVPTPVHEFLYAALLPHHLNHLRQRGGA